MGDEGGGVAGNAASCGYRTAHWTPECEDGAATAKGSNVADSDTEPRARASGSGELDGTRGSAEDWRGLPVNLPGVVGETVTKLKLCGAGVVLGWETETQKEDEEDREK